MFMLFAAAPLFLFPVVLAAAVFFTALRFYDDTSGPLAASEHTLAAVANYGGAQVYGRNGELLYRFSSPLGGVQIPARLEDVSPHLIKATVSTEDDSFWESKGVDLMSTGRAAWENFRASGSPFEGRGGSGITQQLVKQTLIAPEERYAPSIQRKANEAVYAMEIAKRYPKEQILEWYLNVINYGGVFDGIESASQGYFGVAAKDLTLAQAAMLAGIPQSPAQYSPYANFEGANRRQAEVLDIMVLHGDITPAEAEAAKQEEIVIREREEALPLRAPWFVEYVRQELIARYGQKCFETCGLSVTTTLDLKLQDKAQEILETNIARHADPVGAHNGSLVSIDGRTGEILLMIGSRNYYDESPPIQGSNNFATAILQPGSAFKPFIYLTLFNKHGYGPESTIWDAPFTTADGYKCENPASIGRMFGPIPVRLALGSSLNCPANRAAATAGIPAVLDMAHRVGITTLGDDPSQYGASIATGGANISLLEMTYAYTTLARNGSMVGGAGLDAEKRPLDPIALREVRDATGRLLYRYEPESKQVIPAAHAYLVNNITSDCSARRLIWACGFPIFDLADKRPVAAKTGTQQGGVTQDTIASWQFIYTPNLIVGGWVGNADRTSWRDRNGGGNAVGNSVQQLLQHIVNEYEIPRAEFERPAEVISKAVHVPDASRGTSGCGPIQQALFARGSEPDVNNRICVNGRLTIPKEQVGTGGLPATYMGENLPCVPANATPPSPGQQPQFGPPCPTSTPGGSGAGTLISPAGGSFVAGNVPISAVASGRNVSIQWGAGGSPVAWNALGVSVSGGTASANWSTSGLAPGPYVLRLLVDGQVVSMVGVNVAGTAPVTPPRQPAPTPPPAVPTTEPTPQGRGRR